MLGYINGEYFIVNADTSSADMPAESYEKRVSALIRRRYSIDDELALSRQRDVKPDEWREYNDYCEQCKQTARIEEVARLAGETLLS